MNWRYLPDENCDASKISPKHFWCCLSISNHAFIGCCKCVKVSWTLIPGTSRERRMNLNITSILHRILKMLYQCEVGLRNDWWLESFTPRVLMIWVERNICYVVSRAFVWTNTLKIEDWRQVCFMPNVSRHVCAARHFLYMQQGLCIVHTAVHVQ